MLLLLFTLMLRYELLAVARCCYVTFDVLPARHCCRYAAAIAAVTLPATLALRAIIDADSRQCYVIYAPRRLLLNGRAIFTSELALGNASRCTCAMHVATATTCCIAIAATYAMPPPLLQRHAAFSIVFDGVTRCMR